MKNKAHAKAQRREGLWPAKIVRRVVLVGGFVSVLMFLFGRRTSDPREGGALGGDQSTGADGIAGADGIDISVETEREFSLGLRRVHRKPSSLAVEESEVPYFLRRVDDRGAREIVVSEVVNLGAAPSSDITVNVFSEEGVIWGGGSATDVVGELDPEALSTGGTEKLEDAFDHPPDHGE